MALGPEYAHLDAPNASQLMFRLRLSSGRADGPAAEAGGGIWRRLRLE